MEPQRLRLRFKKCVSCQLVNDEADDIKECKDDISCPAGKVAVIIGEDPEIIIESLVTSFIEAAKSFDAVNDLLPKLSSAKPDLVTAALNKIIDYRLLDTETADVEEASPEDQDFNEDEDEILS